MQKKNKIVKFLGSDVELLDGIQSLGVTGRMIILGKMLGLPAAASGAILGFIIFILLFILLIII